MAEINFLRQSHIATRRVGFPILRGGKTVMRELFKKRATSRQPRCRCRRFCFSFGFARDGGLQPTAQRGNREQRPATNIPDQPAAIKGLHEAAFHKSSSGFAEFLEFPPPIFIFLTPSARLCFGNGRANDRGPAGIRPPASGLLGSQAAAALPGKPTESNRKILLRKAAFGQALIKHGGMCAKRGRRIALCGSKLRKP